MECSHSIDMGNAMTIREAESIFFRAVRNSNITCSISTGIAASYTTQSKTAT